MTQFIQGFVLGFTLGLPVGPLAVLCIRRSLLGHSEGAATALGIALADGFYALLVSLGLGTLGTFLLTQQEYITLACGIFLGILGVKALLYPPDFELEKIKRLGFSKVLLQTMLVTLTNAMTLITYMAALPALGFGRTQPLSQAVLVSLGVCVGSLSWFGLLSTGVSLLRHTITPHLFRLINLISGSIFIAFGLFLFSKGLYGLLL